MTSIVNLHGCRLSTTQQVMVGVAVTVETPHSGSPAKAICVHVWDPEPGERAHDIAVQLLKPQNLWGLKNPPADWVRAAEMLAQARGPKAESGPSPEGSGAPPDPSKAELARFIPPDAAMARFEERVWHLVDSAFQVLQTQTEELQRGTLEEFRQQVDVLVKDGGQRLQERAEHSYDEIVSSLETLRADLAEQMTRRTEQMVETAMAAVAEKVGEIFAARLAPSRGKPAEPAQKK